MEISDRSIAILAIFAIALSFLGILASLGIFTLPPTGAASTGTGEVNITLPTAMDILMLNNSVNFTGTLVGVNRVTTVADDLEPACGVGEDGCGFGIKNDGTVFINISSTEDAIDPLFESPQYNSEAHFTLNTSLGADQYGDTPYNSSVGYERHTDYSTTESWAPVNYSGCIVCQLNYTAATSGQYYWWDVAFIHVNVTVPEGEPSGEKGGTLIFTATDAGLTGV